MTPPRRGIWAETAPPEALADPATYRALARFGADVALAVRPADVERVATWVDLAASHGVRASLWPMIDDASGRWLSTASAEPFRDFARALIRLAPRAEIVLDLEPPFALVRGALDGRAEAARGMVSLLRDSPERRRGERLVVELCAELSGACDGLTLAVVPFILFDAPRARPGWSRLFGPHAPLPATRVNAMLYTTLVEGYSRGVLRRADARALLAAGCRAMLARFGARAAVSLGAVGTGALGDEPVYPDPAALADDVAIALACGVRDLWLFDLGGVLARGGPEVWLRALVDPSPAAAPPAPTARSRALSAAMWAAGAALSLASAALRPAHPGEEIAEHGTPPPRLW